MKIYYFILFQQQKQGYFRKGRRKPQTKQKQHPKPQPTRVAQAGSCTTGQVNFLDFKNIPSHAMAHIFQALFWLFKPTPHREPVFQVPSTQPFLKTWYLSWYAGLQRKTTSTTCRNAALHIPAHPQSPEHFLVSSTCTDTFHTWITSVYNSRWLVWDCIALSTVQNLTDWNDLHLNSLSLRNSMFASSPQHF